MSVIHSLQNLPYELIYVGLSAVVAIIILVEGNILRKTQGKMPTSTLFHFGSLIDTLWLPISMACWYYLELQSIAIVVPIAYTIYKIFGLFYGTSLMSAQGIPDSAEDLVVPMKLVDYTQSFALIFLALCALAIFSPSLSFSVPFL